VEYRSCLQTIIDTHSLAFVTTFNFGGHRTETECSLGIELSLDSFDDSSKNSSPLTNVASFRLHEYFYASSLNATKSHFCVGLTNQDKQNFLAVWNYIERDSKFEISAAPKPRSSTIISRLISRILGGLRSLNCESFHAGSNPNFESRSAYKNRVVFFENIDQIKQIIVQQGRILTSENDRNYTIFDFRGVKLEQQTSKTCFKIVTE
ncbi:MAG: hypothetical protein ACRDFB_03455, partial [Rhabdochlamydiaceae bacterium]